MGLEANEEITYFIMKFWILEDYEDLRISGNAVLSSPSQYITLSQSG
jgi:hypothetical protein